MQRIIFSGRNLLLILLVAFSAALPGVSHAVVTCGSTCYTAAQVAEETTNYQQGVPGSKCIFIYDGKIYQPPLGTIKSGTHQNEHSCGTDVTGIMKQTHLNSPNNYLLPYVCAPLCAACQDADGDGFQAASCGGNDCNDGNPAVKPGATEACNGVDDDCDGQTDEGGVCAPPPNQTNQSTPPPATPPPVTPPANVTTCVPTCATLCGQNNGCGGTCPDNDTYTPGKCGNSACVPDCTAGACGQPDGCGGVCAASDAGTCGVCGNAPCCTEEVCDSIDNDCDGQTDENCAVVNTVAATPASFAFAATEAAASVVTRADAMARVAGILAFFFAGLTLEVGIFRRQLINKFGRKHVIRFHSTVAVFSFMFLAVHLASVLLDASWSQTIKLPNVFLPQFTGIVLFNAAFGTVGMYLLSATIVSGALFMKISRRFGYGTWRIIHNLSFLFYVFVFYHALNIGTDFRNPYIIIFFSHVIIVIGAYIAYRTYTFYKKRAAAGEQTTSADGK